MFAFGLPPTSRFRLPVSAAAATATSATFLRRKHLLILIRSSFEELYCFDKYGIKEFWHEKLLSTRRYNLKEVLPHFFSGTFSSCMCFFGGKESDRDLGGNGKSHLETSKQKPSSGRLWTNALLAMNVIAFAAQFASEGKLIMWGAKINSFIDEGQLWRLVTSSFLHANIGHLLINCYSLNSVGPAVEILSGPKRFLMVYFASAIASSTMSYYFCKAPAVGASGAVFGLVGSFAVFVLRHRNIVQGAKQDLQQIAHITALNMAIGLLSRGIDNWGHLGGLLGGAAISWFLGPVWRYEYSLGEQRAVVVDRAPIFRLLKQNERKQ